MVVDASRRSVDDFPAPGPNQTRRFHQFGQAYGSFVLLGIILLGRITGFSILSILLGPPIAFCSRLLLG